MLSIQHSESAQGVLKYFDEELSRGDYYTGRGELPGQWHGRAAAELGLSGEVQRKEFAALANNLHPETGEQITARTKENRRPGYDFTFGAPKSVSMLYEYLRHEGRDAEATKLLGMFDASVKEAMAEVEANMQARVRDKGQNFDRTTGNIIWTSFTHFQGRPAELPANEHNPLQANDKELVADPHLHTHAYVFNITRDGNAYKAGQFGQLVTDRVYYQSVFFDRLASKLQEAGYATERQSVSFELAGITRETVEKFSRRTEEVAERAKQLGVSSAKGRRNLAAVTRAEKDEGKDPEETRKIFVGRLSPDEKATLARIAEGGAAPPPSSPSRGECLDHAVAHWFERRSVVTEKRLYATAIMHGLGTGISEHVAKEARARRELIFGRDEAGTGVVTTRAVRAEERALKRFVEGGQVMSYAEMRKARGLEEFTPMRAGMSAEQRAVVRHVLESTDRVIGIRGGAGTGKTFTMQEVVKGIEESTGKRVVVVAPTTTASHETLRESGFEQADTLAQLLKGANAKELQAQAKGGIIYVDEAGMIGAKTMRELFELSERLGARVILQGDTRQHASVERGDALRYLETRAGLRFAELTEIRRQEEPAYKDAIETFAKGDVAAGYGKLDAMEAIREVAPDELHAMLARDYLDVLDAAPKRLERQKVAIIVAPTHAEGRKVTELVREGLKLRGKLGEARLHQQLVPIGWSEAERGAAYSYRAGQVVEFLQNASGFRKGTRTAVTDIQDGKVITLTGEALPLEEAARFQVYERRDVELAAGDVVRITKGGKDAGGQRMSTNARYTVQGFGEDGSVLLGAKEGTVTRRLKGEEALHLAHGYAVTSHASQSASVEYVFASQSADSFPAANKEQAYVTFSRGKKAAFVYTDDKAGLLDAIRRSSARMFASDVREPRRDLPPSPAPQGADGAQGRAARFARTWEKAKERIIAVMTKAARGRREEEYAAAFAYAAAQPRMPEARPLLGKWTSMVAQRERGRDREPER